MGKPPVKSTKALIQARLLAEYKFANSKKGREMWTRAQFEKVLDKIDPIELLAVISGTFVIYDIILGTPAFIEKTKDIVIEKATYLSAIAGIMALFRSYLPAGTGGAGVRTREEIENIATNELNSKVLIQSFTLSYILVKHAGQIINGTFTIAQFIAGSLGLVAAV